MGSASESSTASRLGLNKRTVIATALLCAAPFAAYGADPPFPRPAGIPEFSELQAPLRNLYEPSAPMVELALRVEADSLSEPASPSPELSPSTTQPPPSTQEKDAPSEEPGAKNPRKALLYSLLLPGLGELHLGHKGRATGFFITEGVIWANFALWRYSGNLRKDDYIEQAQLNAGVGVDSESDDYWRLVGAYERSSGSGASYEEDLRREARNEFPSDPAAQDAYVAERLPVGDRAWDWSTAQLQSSYVDTRQSSQRAYDRADYSIAFAILNRIASAIDTQILHRQDVKAGRAARDDEGTHLLALRTADGGGRVLIRRSF